MSASYIPPFPNGNASEGGEYTEVFDKVRRKNRRPSGAPEHNLANPRTTSNPRNREPEPHVTASPLHQSNLAGGRSPFHHQGSSGNSPRGGSGGSGNTQKPVNPNYIIHPSPNPHPSKSNASGRAHESRIGNSTPARNTPSRNRKKPTEQAYDDLLPPFPPSDGTDQQNYTEVFSRYQKGSTPATDQPVPPYIPRRAESPKLQRCSCFGL